MSFRVETDSMGKVDKRELKKAMGGLSEKEVQAMVRLADKDGDDEVDF